jgi:transposase
MGRNKKYGNIILTDEDRIELEKLSKSQTGEYRKVQRAKILLMSAKGMLNSEIAAAIGMHPNTVASIITKYISAGKDHAINDAARPGKPNVISDEEKLWITSIACTKPKELGYAQELWTYRQLQKHVRTHCKNAGYPGLTKISANTIYSILDSNEIKPNKINYYLVRKDPDFETRMREVLVVYKQVEMCFDDEGRLTIDMPKTVTLSYDEKPGIQALKNIAPDLPPTQKHGTVSRDYEYKRLGTVSLLAGIDLLTGEIIPQVSDTHKSSDVNVCMVCVLKASRNLLIVYTNIAMRSIRHLWYIIGLTRLTISPQKILQRLKLIPSSDIWHNIYTNILRTDY